MTLRRCLQVQLDRFYWNTAISSYKPLSWTFQRHTGGIVHLCAHIVTNQSYIHFIDHFIWDKDSLFLIVRLTRNHEIWMQLDSFCLDYYELCDSDDNDEFFVEGNQKLYSNYMIKETLIFDLMLHSALTAVLKIFLTVQKTHQTLLPCFHFQGWKDFGL